jgi:outer membrane biosynthesis protein TonB
MNEHAGSASALSVLIIGIFAILLHDRQPTPTRQQPADNTKAVAKTSITEAVEPPRIVKATPIVEPQRPVEEPKKRPESVVKAEVLPTRPSTPPTPPLPSVVTSRPPQVPAKKGPFTIVQSGESLADVAARVYGTTDAAESLWRANRDQVVAIDSSLTKGMLLRTP